MLTNRFASSRNRAVLLAGTALALLLSSAPGLAHEYDDADDAAPIASTSDDCQDAADQRVAGHPGKRSHQARKEQASSECTKTDRDSNVAKPR